jgi:hypothetical protein
MTNAIRKATTTKYDDLGDILDELAQDQDWVEQQWLEEPERWDGLA